MKLGVPWSVKGIRPEARNTAQEAARRSGVSLGEWLNSVILHQAEQQGIDPHAQARDEDYGAELAGVHHRLDDLTRRIDQLMRSGPAAYAPPHTRAAADNAAALSSRLEHRLDQFANASRPAAPPLAPSMPAAPGVHLPPGLDRAVAEIAARRRALGSPSAPQPQAAAPLPMQAPMPAQNLSGLEDQLRRITDQIETLRRPGIEEAINALRAELGEIGHALSEAMPRQAVDTLERQIAGLSQRIADGRQAGVDHGALASIEHGLAEVRDAVRGLTPAESLVGFNDAVGQLAHKIDLIVAQKDPATLQQLEHAITTLRDMANHVASNEAVGQLAAQVHALSEKVDHVAYAAQGGDALAYLDQRISALADALAERQQNGGAVPPRLETLVQSLSDKIEQIQASRGDNVAIGHLEDRIVNLVEKLDQSESRLGQLEAIERGLGDLLVHIEDMRAGKHAAAPHPESQPVVNELKHDMARTQDALEAVHGTLGHLVDRLALLEKGMRGGERAPTPAAAEDTPAPPFGKLAVRAVSDAVPEPPQAPPPPPVQPPKPPQSAAEAKPAGEPPRMPKAAPLQMPEPARAAPEPSLQVAPQRRAAASLPHNEAPADLPLEPGSGRPKFNARIAASEAALGGAGPAAAPPGGKSSFIAAARRAARAALQQGSAAGPRAEPQAAPEDRESALLRGKVMKRVKSLFIAASIIAIVIGAFQIAGTFFNLGSITSETAKTGQADTGTADAPAGAARKVRKIAEDRPAAPALGATSNSSGLGTVAPGPTGFARIAPPLLSPPVLGAPPATAKADKKADITGSIPKPAAGAQPETQTSSDRLPTAIGGARLRSAALAGDVGAAYEVAVRYADGRGVPANMHEAAQWFARAARLGLAPAQFRYASMLEKGQGVRKDLGEARRFYRAAAEQGHGKAMHNLAVLYAEGIDGKPDYASAVKWFHQAALRGIADSQYNLGVLAARGLGTEKSFEEAYKWFALAAAQGDQESAKKRDEIASQLDDDALAAARQAVKSFRVEPQPKKAVTVPKPQGGWDHVADDPAPAPKAKPQPQREPQPSHAPLSLGSFTIGKR